MWGLCLDQPLFVFSSVMRPPAEVHSKRLYLNHNSSVWQAAHNLPQPWPNDRRVWWNSLVHLLWAYAYRPLRSLRPTSVTNLYTVWGPYWRTIRISFHRRENCSYQWKSPKFHHPILPCSSAPRTTCRPGSRTFKAGPLVESSACAGASCPDFVGIFWWAVPFIWAFYVVGGRQDFQSIQSLFWTACAV